MKETSVLFCILYFIGISFGYSNKRPNILFAFADDMGRYASKYAEIDKSDVLSKFIKTPNFDKIANEGVIFRNAFVSSPSCTPCRSAMLSGKHFWQTGQAAILQGAVWNKNIPTWPLLLEESGYHIGYTYKVWGPGRPVNAGYGGDAKKYQLEPGNYWQTPSNTFSDHVTWQVKSDKKRNVEEVIQSILSQVKANFVSFLNDQKEGKPFSYFFGCTNPHRYWNRGSGKRIWGLDPDDLKGLIPPFMPDVEAIREDLADYLGEVIAYDTMLGSLIEVLKERGEYDNTLIVISGDHGAPGFPNGKCNLYDFGTRVPMIIAGPGVQGARVIDDYVSVQDVAPTFLEAGGVEPPKEMTAKSLWPTLKSMKEGMVDKNRNFVLIGREKHVWSARQDKTGYPQRAIRTEDYLFIINFKPERYPMGDPYHKDLDEELDYSTLKKDTHCTYPDFDAGPTKAWLIMNRHNEKYEKKIEKIFGKRPKYELYDVRQDPHQIHNLAYQEKYMMTRTNLEHKLLLELRRNYDPRVVGDGLYFDKPPFVPERHE